MTKFFKGTLILLVSGFITRVLGFINRIVMARYVGEEGVGLFMMASPTLFLVIAATQIGLPVAISKYVAESIVTKNIKKIKSVIIISLLITFVLSLLFTPIMFFGAKFMAHYLFSDERIYYPLVVMTPIVPITAVAAVLRGYFQGKQEMNPYAWSLVIEQVVRIIFVMITTKYFIPYGIEYATAAAVGAAVLGELFSLLFLLKQFRLSKSFSLHKNFFRYVKDGRATLNDLLSIALPTTGSRMIGSISWFIEPIVVSQSLLIAGVSAQTATKWYGELTGYALPLLMLPSFITFSFGTSLIPSLSELYIQKKHVALSRQLHQSLRITFISGALSVVIMYVLAEPLMQLMYGTTTSAHYVKVLAPFFLLFFYQGPLQASLQAFNMSTAAMVNSFIGALVKIILVLLLATQPNIAMKGVTISLGVSISIVTLLHFISLWRKISLPIYFGEHLKMAVIIIVTGYVGNYMYQFLQSQVNLLSTLIYTILVMTAIFLLLLIVLRVYSYRELRQFLSFR